MTPLLYHVIIHLSSIDWHFGTAVAKSGWRQKKEVDSPFEIGGVVSTSIGHVDHTSSSQEPKDQVVDHSHRVCTLSGETAVVPSVCLTAAIVWSVLDVPMAAHDVDFRVDGQDRARSAIIPANNVQQLDGMHHHVV
jgi:hypothetical protein